MTWKRSPIGEWLLLDAVVVTKSVRIRTNVVCLVREQNNFKVMMAQMSENDLHLLERLEQQIEELKALCDRKLAIIRLLKNGQPVDDKIEWPLFAAVNNETSVRRLVLSTLAGPTKETTDSQGKINGEIEKAKIFLQNHRSVDIINVVECGPESDFEMLTSREMIERVAITFASLKNGSSVNLQKHFEIAKGVSRVHKMFKDEKRKGRDGLFAGIDWKTFVEKFLGMCEKYANDYRSCSELIQEYPGIEKRLSASFTSLRVHLKGIKNLFCVETDYGLEWRC